MKRFRWSLQRLLDVTVRRESSQRAVVAELAGKLDRARRERRRREVMLGSALAELNGLDADQRVAAQSLCMRFIRHAREEIDRMKELAEALDAQRQQAANEYRRLHRSRKTLERLREQALGEHRQAELAEEQKFLDECASLRFARQMRTCQVGRIG